MKKALILFSLVIMACTVFAQKNSIQVDGGSVRLDFKGTYLIQSDTSATGVITIVMSPTDQIEKELDSKLGGLLGEKDLIQANIQASQDELKRVNEAIREVRELIKGLQKRN